MEQTLTEIANLIQTRNHPEINFAGYKQTKQQVMAMCQGDAYLESKVTRTFAEVEKRGLPITPQTNPAYIRLHLEKIKQGLLLS